MSREIIARGRSLREAFVETALAMFSLAVDPTTVEPREIRETRAHGEKLETLLAHWIAECAYVHEVEGFVCRTIDLSVFDLEPKAGGEPLRLYAFLHGEAMDPDRHLIRGALTSVPSVNITIATVAEGCEIRLSTSS